jgi:serine/threonine protein kinase
MTPERLQQIQELYLSVRDRDPGNRPAFLAQACGGDEDLRSEVESLLVQNSSEVMDRPAVEVAAELLANGNFGPGVQIGPYRIESALGAGGMGEVFLATDSRLGRKVAIKTCREQFSERFHREARAISSLNHPHICTLYDVGPNYLVMELVEGETLADRVKRGKLSIEQTIQYGSQIADALAAAHAKGIIHRDLKPANIMLTKSGVKVLDFGLAKSAQDQTLTATNAVMGTPAYMAPEQQEGKECDACTDIYALGLVLYEMAIGRRAAHDQSASTQNLPAPLAHTIDRCLPQDPVDRWQSARDIQAELVWAANTEPSSRQTPMLRRTAITGMVSGLAGAAVALGLASLRKTAADTRILRFSVAPPAGAEFLRTPNHGGLAISPDGQKLTFLAVRNGQARLWVQPLDSLSAQELPGTEDASHPFWSPDSRSIAFFAGGSLNRINADGSGLQRLWVANVGQIGSWGQRGTILFSPRGARGPIYRLDSVGGKPVQVTTLDTSRGEVTHEVPQFLSDGTRFLYLISRTQGFLGPDQEGSGVYIGSIDDPKLKSRILPAIPWFQEARAGANDYLLWLRNDTLMAQKWDPDTLQTRGDPAALGGPVGVLANDPYFAVSENGPLVYGGPLDLQLQWLDRSGKLLSTFGETGMIASPRQSPEGRRVAVVRNNVLEVIDLERHVTSRLATGVANRSVSWSPDGNKIAFAAVGTNGKVQVLIKNANGTGPQTNLAPSSKAQTGVEWTPDGRALLYLQMNPENRTSLWIASLGAKEEAHPVLGSSYEEGNTAISPDGRWLAYVTDESGQPEVYTQRLDLQSGTAHAQRPRTQVSGDGGSYPRWRGDGKEIFYQGRNGKLTAVAVKPAALGQDALESETPRALFSLPVTYNAAYSYDVSRDGQRFLVVAPFRRQSREPLTVIVNWRAVLKD